MHHKRDLLVKYGFSQVSGLFGRTQITHRLAHRPIRYELSVRRWWLNLPKGPEHSCFKNDFSFIPALFTLSGLCFSCLWY